MRDLCLVRFYGLVILILLWNVLVLIRKLLRSLCVLVLIATKMVGVPLRLHVRWIRCVINDLLVL